MQELLWNITKFNHIFSYPSDTSDGAETYAQDMVNLRVDRWGHLRLRPVIRALQMHEEADIGDEDISVVGVAAAAEKLFWLESGGILRVADNVPADPVDVDLESLNTLSGRLSAVDIGGTTIITSERDDRGIAVRDDVLKVLGNKAAQPLSLPSPVVSVVGASFFGGTSDPLTNVIVSVGQPITQLPANPIPGRIYEFSEDQPSLSSRVINWDVGGTVDAASAGDFFIYRSGGETWSTNATAAGQSGIVANIVGKETPKVGERFRVNNTGTTYTITAVDVSENGATAALTFTPALTRQVISSDNLRSQSTWWKIIIPLQDEYTYYKFTYSGNGILGDLESFESNAIAVKHRNRENENALLETVDQFLVVQVTTKPADSRITHINIYRSDVTKSEGDDDDGLNYLRLNDKDELALPENTSNYPIYFVDDHSEVSTIRLFNNSPMPEDISQIVLYNDRLFGANTTELRFTDVRNAIPIWGAWPVLNSITTGQRIEFCAEYRGMLLFGASDNLYRLSGTSPANFRYDRISSRGPVSPHAWGILDNAFGFVGSDGLYMSDGTQAPEIATPLKGYFNRYEIEDGFVGMLPNKASLWGIHRRNKSTDDTDIIYFVKDGNDWTRIAEGDDGSHIRQYTSVKFDGLPITGVIADQQRAPRLVDWVVDDETVDELTKYTGQDTPPTEDIEWSWESQQLDWNSQALGSEMKVFKELLIDGTAENDVTVTFYIDDMGDTNTAIQLNRASGNRFDYRRVPIDRRGFALRFKIAGTGDVTIRGLRIRAYV